MKHNLTDALQVMLAIIITTSLVVVNAAPLSQKQVQVKKPVQHIAVVKPVETPAPAQPQVAQETVSAPETVVDTTPTPEPVVEAPVASQPIYTGSHEDMMAAAGISPGDYLAVDYIISHESSWNPDATEPTSGAHGLPQALPYSKTGCGWSDGICQLQWATSYATSRYGGWQGAYSFWVVNHYW
jgi:hypothetical protein